jgi:EmrB/QacA subfamily drug resistance transporter
MIGTEAEGGVGTAAAPGGRRPALATLSAVLFLTFLDTTIVSVALADVQSSLHAGVSQLQWVVNGYALTFASLMLGMGMLGDRLGRKRVMLGGLGVFIAGSLLGALSPTVGTLVGARVVMGVGAAASEPGTLSIIRHLYPEPARRARAVGVWVAVAGLGLALGPVIGGILVGLAGWRLVLWFNLAAGLLVMLAALLTVPESSDPVPSRVDAAGLVLGPLALGAAIFAVIHGETTGYSDPVVIALFAVSAVTALLFVAVERRSADPIFDVAYLRRGSFTGSLTVAFAAYFGVFSIFFFTALYLQVVVGYSAYRTAALFVPMAIAMIAASALTGRWVAHSGPRLPTVFGCLAAGAGMVATDAALHGHVGFATLAPALALAGLGFGVAVVPVTSVALAVIPAEHSGMAAGATTTSRELGAVVGVAVLGSLVNGHLTIDLARRLAGLGVPAGFRDVVITAVETGQVPKGGAGGAAAAAQAFGPIVAKVIDAAYGAFRAGLTISLLLAGAVILVSGLVAWFTLAPGPSKPELEH